MESPQSLTYQDRIQIENLLKAGKTITHIAAVMNKSRRTITREIEASIPKITLGMLYDAHRAHLLAIGSQGRKIALTEVVKPKQGSSKSLMVSETPDLLIVLDGLEEAGSTSDGRLL